MNSRARALLIALAFVAFVSLGLPDGILGVAWPSVRHQFSVPVSRLGLLLIAGTSGYLLSSFFAGQVQRKLSIGGVLVVSNCLVLIGLTGNALTPGFYPMMLFGFCGGLGAGAIDAAINAFAAREFPPRWVSWLHACYGIGAMLGPLIMTTVLVRGLSWRWGYGSVAAIIAVLCVLFLLTIKLWQADDSKHSPHDAEPHAGIVDTLSQPIVWMHIALFFVYAGIEVTAGQWFYSIFTESRGWTPAIAGVAVSSYWAGLTAGRIGFGFAAEHMRRRTLLRIATVAAPASALLIAANLSTAASFTGAVLLGISLAPIFPLLISATPARVGGQFAAQTIGFEVSAATVGVAVLPTIAGYLARQIGLEVVAPYLLALCILLLVLHELTILSCARERLRLDPALEPAR